MKLYLIALVMSVLLGVSSSALPYSTLCDTAFCRILDKSLKEITDLSGTVDEGSCISEFGSKADQICNSALEIFSQEAPLPDDNPENEAIYDKKIDDLEKMLDSPLHVLYLKQLSLLREKALKTFKSTLALASGSEFEAMMKADETFRNEAEEATRQNPEWSYAREITNLKNNLLEIANKSKKIAEIKERSEKQTEKAMQYLQIQNQQLQAIQQQIQGAYSPWNMAVAYRVPDSNFNVQCNYQQGQAKVQISCVPDESVPLLGPNGFTNGVTAGNVGLSFNINL